MRRSDSILHNSLLFFTARVIDLSSGIVGFVLVARLLGVEGLGRYSFVIAFVSVLGLVVNLGMDHIIIRELSKDSSRLPFIIGAAVKLKARLLLITIPLLTGGIFVFHLDKELVLSSVFLFIAALFLREFYTVIPHAVFLALEKLEYRAYTTLVFQIVRLGGMAGALTAGWGLTGVFATAIIADLLQAAMAMMILKKLFAPPDYSISIEDIKGLFRQSLSLGFAFGFIAAFLQVDILLLRNMCGDYESGLFASAYRFISMIILVIVPVTWVLLPHLTRSFNFERENFLRESRFYLKGIAVVIFPAAIVLGVYSQWLQILFFGDAYSAAAPAMIIMTPTLIFRGLGYLFDLSFTAADKQKMTAVVAGTAFFVKIILDLILIPSYKHMGAAYGTLGAEIIAFIVSYILLIKNVGDIKIISTLYKPFTAGIIALASLVFLLPDYPVAGILFCAVIFIVLILLFGTFDRRERTNILALIERKAGKIPGLSRIFR